MRASRGNIRAENDNARSQERERAAEIMHGRTLRGFHASFHRVSSAGGRSEEQGPGRPLQKYSITYTTLHMATLLNRRHSPCRPVSCRPPA
jgi:hypothetical protein